MTFKIKISEFYDLPETKMLFSHGTYSNPTSFFIGQKIIKYFNYIYNWHLSISLQKSAQTCNVELK